MRSRFAVLVTAAFVLVFGATACGGAVEEEAQERVEEEVQEEQQKVEEQVQEATQQVEQEAQEARQRIEEEVQQQVEERVGGGY